MNPFSDYIEKHGGLDECRAECRKNAIRQPKPKNVNHDECWRLLLKKRHEWTFIDFDFKPDYMDKYDKWFNESYPGYEAVHLFLTIFE